MELKEIGREAREDSSGLSEAVIMSASWRGEHMVTPRHSGSSV